MSRATVTAHASLSPVCLGALVRFNSRGQLIATVPLWPHDEHPTMVTLWASGLAIDRHDAERDKVQRRAARSSVEEVGL